MPNHFPEIQKRPVCEDRPFLFYVKFVRISIQQS